MPTSATRREYIPVVSAPASLRATVAAADIEAPLVKVKMWKVCFCYFWIDGIGLVLKVGWFQF